MQVTTEANGQHAATEMPNEAPDRAARPPALSPESVRALLELLGQVTISVSHPQFDEVTAVWSRVRGELLAIAAHSGVQPDVTPE